MKINKKIILVIIIVILLGSVAGYLSTQNKQFYNGKRVWISHVSRSYDTSKPETAVNVSDYVFVAKVNKVLRTEYRNPVEVEIGIEQTIIQKDPYTIYEIEVVENLKGNLKTDKPIEFVQYGGINEDGKSYSMLADSSFLNVGDYYLLMVGVIPDTLEIEISDNNRMICLGNDLAKADNVINTYKELISSEANELNEIKNKNISKFDVNYRKDELEK